jgi:hypothetical protein
MKRERERERESERKRENSYKIKNIIQKDTEDEPAFID